MPIPRLTLRDAAPPAAGLPTRADVALFVGLIGRRPAPLPPATRAALEAAGWAGGGAFARPPAQVEALLDVPVAVDSFAAFEALYAWDQRVLEAGAPTRVPSRLGLAVKSFFAEGGARAWIVRTGDPLPLLSQQPAATVSAAKRRLVAWAANDAPADAAGRVPLIPGFADQGNAGEATAPATWRGVEHVWGLEEVALLLLPDLPELFAPAPEPLSPLAGPPPVPEHWKTCAPLLPSLSPVERPARPPVSAPRLDRAAYAAWGSAVGTLLRRLDVPRGSAHRRDVMLIASLPLPSAGPDAVPARSEAWPLAILDEVATFEGQPLRLLDPERIGSARLQLAYPWIETRAASRLPEGVEGAEGVLAGALARSALALGAFRSAGGAPLPTVLRLVPELGTGDLERGLPDGRASWLGERLSLIGTRSGRCVLLSDSTTSASSAWRAAGVSRLMGIVLRAARWLGQERLFDAAGPALWAGMRRDLEAFLEQLRRLGALDGATPAQAYEVRCDASTMTQADIDAGRTIVRIALKPAQPIEWITVTLALGAGAPALEEAA